MMQRENGTDQGDRETIDPDPDSRGRMAAGRNPCVSGHTGSGNRDLPVGESDPGYLCTLQCTDKKLLYQCTAEDRGKCSGWNCTQLLRFELPKLLSGDMVVDARLCVYCYSSGTSNVTVGVSQAYGEWKSQEVTWATQPMVNGNLDDYVVFKPETGVAQVFPLPVW